MNPQRFLALAGLGSRRACDALIREGRVTVNGAILEFGNQIDDGDLVCVDGSRIGEIAPTQYIALNKPHGLISDHGIPRAKSALDLPGLPRGLHAVGRLDKDATGLLLLTNDGDLSFRLAHPSFEHEKEYRVLVEGVPSHQTLEAWRQGILLDGTLTSKARVTSLPAAPQLPDEHLALPVRAAVHREPSGAATWLQVILREGRKRQIKKVAKLLGHPVRSLVRVRIGTLELGGLRPGAWRHLDPSEIAQLRNDEVKEAI